MRKPPLIALTAFTALGASAIAGTTTGSFPKTALTSARSARHLPALPTTTAVNTTGELHLLNSTTLSVTGGRDLVAVHDILLTNRSNLNIRTGLPPRPHPRRVHVAVVSTPTPRSAPAPVVVPAEAPSPPPPPPPVVPAGGVWYELRICESGDNYATNTGNGYYGAYQFSLQTWYGLGYSGLPSDAPPAVQDEAAAQLQARSGWYQWPQCAAELGL
ncbi:MAG: transglycosylase family protein [Acidimicrobiales bacterium]